MSNKLSPADIRKLLIEKAQEMYPEGFDIVYGGHDSIMVNPKIRQNPSQEKK